MTIRSLDRYPASMFRLRAPLTRPADVDALADAGADSFFCGVVDPADEVEVASANRRANPEANLHGVGALAEACNRAHDRGRTVFLALNEHHFVPAHLPRFATRIGEARTAGADGVIVSNLALLDLAREVFPRDGLVASVGFAVRNGEAVRFLQSRGVGEVVLSRDLRPAEAVRLALAHPGMAFEVFARNSRCGNIDGLCGYSHHCLDGIPYDVGCMEVEDPKAPRLRLRSCAACQLHAFRAAPNIRTFKVAGRDFPADRVIADVAFMRVVLDRLAIEDDGAAFAAFAEAEYARQYGVSCGRDCYYEA